MILVPVKNLENAKARLSEVLNPAMRQELARAMCTDVLETLANWGQSAVSVVTRDPYARRLANELGFDSILDDANPGETGAIEMATKICRARGERSTLVLPADIPMIEVSELQKIFEAAPADGSLLVPDAAGRGTNAAWRAPADLFPLRFGNDSFVPHLAAAKATGKPCVVLELAGVGLDVDRPDDLETLAAASGDRHSQRLVRSWSPELRAQVSRG
jgi:2-phospho-L-lactate/phosphoenolpyruvate guanylyltransferase